MNWYKKAQINGGKSKVLDTGSYLILGRNTKINEGPWRLSQIGPAGDPWGHEDFDTYEDALDRYDGFKGIDKNVYELV